MRIVVRRWNYDWMRRLSMFRFNILRINGDLPRWKRQISWMLMSFSYLTRRFSSARTTIPFQAKEDEEIIAYRNKQDTIRHRINRRKLIVAIPVNVRGEMVSKQR